MGILGKMKYLLSSYQYVVKKYKPLINKQRFFSIR